MSDEKYTPPEEHQTNVARSAPKKTASLPIRTIRLVLLAFVLCGLSFAAGAHYQKQHGAPPKTAAAGGQGGLQRRGFGQGGGLGQVTAIDASSITVQNQRTNASTTYGITNSTTITNNGQTVTADSIKTGDTVVVVPAASGSTTAGRIQVNPSFGGGPGQGTGGSTQSN